MNKLYVVFALVATAASVFAADEKLAGVAEMPVMYQGAHPSAVVTSVKKELPNPFYIYDDKMSRQNHFIPSGWMGDFGDIKMNDHWNIRPATGKTCMRFDYTAERKEGAGWAGVYFQTPPNNWGTMRGGFDLTGYKTLKVKLRGEKGGEVLDKIGLGGISGQTQEGDSDNVETPDRIELSKDWKEYEIDLKGLDLHHVIGGFLWSASADSNEHGITFYLDDLRLEK